MRGVVCHRMDVLPSCVFYPRRPLAFIDKELDTESKAVGQTLGCKHV